MKKSLLAVLLLSFMHVLFAVETGDIVYVAVKQSALKTGNGAFDKTIAKLNYGESLQITALHGNWYEVKVQSDKSLKGWIPAASVTSRKIVTTSSKQVSASADEIALAGKGFNAQVEEEYKTAKKLDYSKVDQMEAFVISDSDLKKFIAEGQLNGVTE